MSDLAFDTAKAIVEEGSIFEMDDFCEAIEQIVKDKIGHAVEEAVNDIDIDEIVRNEMPSWEDEIQDLNNKVEDLQEQLDGRNSLIEALDSRLESQNEMIGRLFKRVIEIEEMTNKVRKSNNALLDKLENSWFGWLIF